MPRKPTVLLLDDEPYVLVGLRRMLARRCEKWAFRFQANPQEALDEIRQGDIDAVVTDIRMPEIDGFEVLRQIRSDPATRDLPVTFLTGCLEDDLKRRALDAGATDLLNKPIVSEELIARIHNMLQLRSYQNELHELNRSLEERVRRRTWELEQARLDVIWRLAKAGEYRDEETGNHVVRVGYCCRLLAEQIGMNPDYIEAISLTGSLHDIGKIGVPDAILLKPGPLTPQERKIMERHCLIGAQILLEEAKGMKSFLQWREEAAEDLSSRRQSVFLTMAADIARSHHERWDGAGYPHRLCGDQIPLCGRMVALADLFDALGSERPYRPAHSDEQVMDIMRSEADGGRFDPMIFNAFLAVQDAMRRVRAEVAGIAPGDEVRAE